MTVKTAHFVVTGEAMTSIARDLLLSDEPGKAYRLLADNLQGVGAVEAALSVLAGTHDLVGDSVDGIDLFPAEDTEQLREYKQNARFIYAGRYRSNKGWRRPVAWVDGFGPADAKWASQQARMGTPGTPDDRGYSPWIRAWNRDRARFYCSQTEDVELVELPDEGRVWVVFEPCGERPHWVNPPVTPQEAVNDALAAGRSLGRRSPQLSVPEDRPTPRPLSKQERARREAEEERREAKRMEQIQQIATEVRARAGDDTFPLKLTDGRELTVPRAPFVRWALCRTDHRDQSPDWANVAPSGVKMHMDNRDHTDWVLGAGLTLDEAYSAEVNDAAWDAAMNFQEEARMAKRRYAGIRSAIEELTESIHPAAVVVDAGDRQGVVGVEIAVFPDSDASRLEEMGDGCIGVIVEQGGPLAHFAIVTRGKRITVMRHPGACGLFTTGARVVLRPKSGRIVVESDNAEDSED